MSTELPNPPVPNEPPMMQPGAPSMFQTWIDAVTKPSSRTYNEITSSPRAKATTAFLWVFLAALVESFFTTLVGGVSQRQLLQRFGEGQQFHLPTFGGSVLNVICGAPIAAVLALLWFILFTGVAHLIARAFGGRGTFDRLAYASAAIFVPFAVVGTVIVLLEAIPFLGFALAFCFIPLSILLVIYAAVIEVIATSAVHQIGTGGAVVSVLALPAGFCICVACVALIGLLALGPAIGNVFSGLGPFPIPTP